MELPAGDPALLPAMRQAGGEVGRQFVDVFVSHHNEDKDALPTINVVFRAR